MDALAYLPAWAAALVAGVFGLLVGSFFNVIIYRMPRRESIAWPPSRCTRCGYRIKTYENIPVLSWLWLRGKCKSCGDPISLQYPLIEALTGFTAALLGYWAAADAGHPPGFKIAVAYLVLASIPIFIIDFRHHLIPDSLTLSGIVLGLGLGFLPLEGLSLLPEDFSPSRLWGNSGSLLGGIGSAVFLWSLGFSVSRLKKKAAMGLGDVKLIGMIGCLFGLKAALVGLMLAAVLGSAFAVPLLVLKKLGPDRHIPFGPFICAGAFVSALWGEPILDWYSRVLN